MTNKKLAFSAPECDCGSNLADKKASIAGMKGNIPMGYCPGCGKAQPLCSEKILATTSVQVKTSETKQPAPSGEESPSSEEAAPSSEEESS